METIARIQGSQFWEFGRSKAFSGVLGCEFRVLGCRFEVWAAGYVRNLRYHMLIYFRSCVAVCGACLGFMQGLGLRNTSYSNLKCHALF